MNAENIKSVLSECCNDLVFVYNGKRSGVTSTAADYKTTYQVWYGNDTKEYDSIDDVMSDPFYGGKSISELIGNVNMRFI